MVVVTITTEVVTETVIEDTSFSLSFRNKLKTEHWLLSLFFIYRLVYSHHKMLIIALSENNKYYICTMSAILHIETATEVCSVALSSNGQLLQYKISVQAQAHSSLLGVFVGEVMEYVRNQRIKLDAISISSGPGSYTGLRIGVSEAKGLSYGLGIPLIALPTHKVMAQQLVGDVEGDSILLCPMIDARRMEVYATFFDLELNVVRETMADIVDADSYQDLLDRHQVVFFGNGAHKCKSVITHPNARFIDDVIPEAKAMIALAEEALLAKDFVDVAYFEPFYLKEFVATVPKNKVINI